MVHIAPGLRRTPQQDRARRRVEHVLDTADQLLASGGADALTTTRLAQAAGISVGSLYQWFPDKTAIVEALFLRYLERFKAVVAELVPNGDPAGAVIDAFTAAFRNTPGFRTMWFGGLRTERLRDVTRPGLSDIANSLAGTLSDCAPGADPRVVVDVAEMTVMTADAVLRQAFRQDPLGDERVLGEAKVLLRGYLAHRLGINPPQEAHD